MQSTGKGHTSGTMVRFSSSELRGEIGRLIARDPSLSQAAVIRQLRSSGFRGSNVRLRVLVDFERMGVQSGGSLEGMLNVRLQGAGRERTLVTASEIGIEIPAQLSQGTHIAINWRATFSAVVTLYGDVIERIRETLDGRIVQPIEHFNRDFIQARIEQQIIGRIITRIGSGSESFIEGVEVDLTNINVTIISSELRGQKGKVRVRA